MFSGLFVLAIATIGIFRFSTMFNRIHVAAKCDTLGALLILSGLIIMSGLTIFSLKLFLVVVFLWLCNPVASHLIARAEFMTNKNIDKICDFIDHEKIDHEKDLKENGENYGIFDANS